MTPADFQPYPDEMDKIAIAMTRLSNAFDFTHFSEHTKAIFEEAVRSEFARLGIEVRVTWQEVTRKTGLDTDEPTGVWIPGVEPIGRLGKEEEETDHDRVRWGVVKGLDGGEPGYIREDGRKTEDPIRKDIL